MFIAQTLIEDFANDRQVVVLSIARQNVAATTGALGSSLVYVGGEVAVTAGHPLGHSQIYVGR